MVAASYLALRFCPQLSSSTRTFFRDRLAERPWIQTASIVVAIAVTADQHEHHSLTKTTKENYNSW